MKMMQEKNIASSSKAMTGDSIFRVWLELLNLVIVALMPGAMYNLGGNIKVTDYWMVAS